MSWIGCPEHTFWLSKHLQRILDYGHRAYLPGGFGYINSDGSVDSSIPVELDLTARSTYVYALASMLGIPGSPRRCDHGIQAITHAFKDPEHDGWFSFIKPLSDKQMRANTTGVPVGNEGAWKSSRSLSYLLQAAAAAKIAQRPHADALLNEVSTVVDKYLWDEKVGRVQDGFSQDFQSIENYHGFSSNLHAISAFIAVADATSEDKWVDRATRITQFFVNQAKQNSWRVPEHYTQNWEPDIEYNVGKPADPRRPYGINIGHCLGFSAWLISLAEILQVRNNPLAAEFSDAALKIFQRARQDSWRKDGHSGFFFTVDYQGKPLIRQRFAWVVTEGIQAAAAILQYLEHSHAPDDQIAEFESYYESYWDYLEGYFICSDGRWIGELNPNNKPDDTVWPGVPDIFHSARVLLAPRLPVSASMPGAIKAGLLDKPLLDSSEVVRAIHSRNR